MKQPLALIVEFCGGGNRKMIFVCGGKKSNVSISIYMQGVLTSHIAMLTAAQRMSTVGVRIIYPFDCLFC